MAKAKVEKDSIELVSMDIEECEEEEIEVAKKEHEEVKLTKEGLKEDDEMIDKQEKDTRWLLHKRRIDLEGMIDKKQEKSKMDFEMKNEVLSNNFRNSVTSLIEKVKDQKEIITSSYGPIVLNSKENEEPIFDINPELDPDGHKFLRKVNSEQDKIPQALLVKLRTVRCLKDKVSSGHYVMMCQVYDRLGGNPLTFNTYQVEEQYRFLSRNLREFSLKKREFLNTENRQLQQSDKQGGS